MATMVHRIGELLVGDGMDGHDVEVTHAATMNDRTWDDIYIGDIQDWFSEVAAMKAGRKPRNEEYRVVINIFCVRDDAQEATEAAISHAATIEEWFAEEPTLGLNADNLSTLRVTESEMALNITYDDASVWRSHVTMRPTVRARLS
jgi:hypothetical protein